MPLILQAFYKVKKSDCSKLTQYRPCW